MSRPDLRFAELPPAAVLPAAAPVSSLEVLCAFALLALVDLSLKLAGFNHFYRMMSAWRTIGTAPAVARMERAKQSTTAVNRARTYYLKHAWCLQRAAAAVCLMRLRGVAAELVIGVQKFPFYAHAWAEVDGVVVNDAPTVKTVYVEIVRC